jgi:hypothetical protein
MTDVGDSLELVEISNKREGELSGLFVFLTLNMVVL